MEKLKESLNGVDARFTSVLLYVLHERLRRMQSRNVWTGLKTVREPLNIINLYLFYNIILFNYEGHPESKERLRIQSAHLLCCSRSLIYGGHCDVEHCLIQLYVGPCHVVNAEIPVAMAVPIEIPTDCGVRGVIRFLQADETLGYLAEEASSRVELFCYNDNARPHTARQTQALVRKQLH